MYWKFLHTTILLFYFGGSFSQNSDIEFNETEQKWIENHTVVYYGFDPAWKPIEFAENGQHTGITRDYVDLISERTGIVFKQHPEANSWEKSVELFKRGELFVLTCVGENETRKAYMDFTQSYATYPFVIVTDKEGPFIGSIQDLNGKTVASPKGYFVTSLLEGEKDIEIKFVYTETTEESMMQITLGNADATMSNLAVVSHYLNYSGFENLKIAAPADYPDMEAKMGVVKSEPILRDILDKTLTTITPKERNQITQNWVSVTYEHGVDMVKVWTIAGISAGVVGLVFVFIVFWNRKLKKEVARRKEAEQQLQVSFEEIKIQKILIEEKNEEVLDSIKYAKRIQNAILPSVDKVNESIPNNFILYIPKDIVAGDFYWMERLENKVLIAAADCTGHGVPGAMVSVICSNALNKSVLEYDIKEPGRILDKTTDLVIERFSKSGEDVKDGMDICLISLEKLENGHTLVEFAGAHNHLWIVSKRSDLGIESMVSASENENYFLHEIKADKQPVGNFPFRKPFNTWNLELLEGERVFLYSDGYADQFGGSDGKKFKNKSFKKLLLQTTELSLSEQKDRLNDTFYQWKKDFEQLDDVCVIGVEV